jgi:electron transfer flavoprotein alpha subunit
MSNDVLVVAEHLNGELSDTTFELLAKGKELADARGGRCAVALLGDASLSDRVGTADLVLTMEHPALAAYTPEAYEKALLQLLEERQPGLVLIPNTTLGMDVGAGLSAAWQTPLVAYVVDLQSEGGAVVATSQVYGGKLVAEAVVEGDRAICTVIAGSFAAEAGQAGGGASIEAVAPPAALDSLATSFVELREPEPGDVDIGAADVLVSVGRGIGNGDDVELVQELADALGAALSASRPVTDKGWLPKTRQVGKSGVKVKPKLYLSFGISGAPEHLEGMRDSELIIACNTDPQAPIFDVAHYGTTADLFDLVPALTEKLRG